MAFDAGDFDEAAEYFDAAYDEAKNPNLRYNAAVAYEEAGDLEMARTRLQDYRAHAPAGEHAELDREIERIEGLIERAEAAEADANVAPTSGQDTADTNQGATSARETPLADDAPTRGSGRAALITTGVITGVAGLSALGFGLAALQRKNEVESQCVSGLDAPVCREKAQDLDQQRKVFAAVTDASIGVAAASAVVFTVLLIRATRQKNRAAHAMVSPVIGRGEAGAALTARF